MASAFIKGFVVHLFVAGRRNYLDDKRGNDGSISTVVSLATVFAVLTGTTIVITYRPYDFPKIKDVTYGILIVLQFLGIFSCFMITILVKCDKITTKRNELSPAIKIRLKFLCLFCLGCLVHFSSQVVCHVYNLQNRSSPDTISKVTSDAVNLLYYPAQTIFLIMFANFKFTPCLCVHYFLVLQMAPCISFWNLFLIKGLHDSNRPNNGTKCGNYTDLSKSVTKIDHLCIPTVIGFSLMVVLMLASIWPDDETQHLETEHGPSNDGDRDGGGKNTSVITPANTCSNDNRNADEEDTLINESEAAMVNSFQKVFEDKIRIYIIFFFSVCVNVPLLVFTVYHYKCHSVERKELKIMFHATALASKLLLFVLQAVGFTMIPICCNIKRDRVHMFTIGNCLLVFGLWGYSFFQTINFISVLEEAYSGAATMFLIHQFMSCLTAVQTTVFLLQMKHYEKKVNCSSMLKSICVKLSGILFSYWVMDTFIESHGLLSTVECDRQNHTYLDLSGRILYPFLIFFRFQNFLSFYEICKIL